MLNERESSNRTSRARAWGVIVAGLALLASTGVSAQEARITQAQPGNRSVKLEWTRVPADTLTPAERLGIPSVSFVVPTGLGYGTSAFRLNQTVVGQGAATESKGTYQIQVGRRTDIFQEGNEPTPSYPADLTLTGTFQFGTRYVGVAFSRPLDSASATNPANYALSPALGVDSATLQENGQTVILRLSQRLPSGTNITVDVTGVKDAQGNGIIGAASGQFNTITLSVTSIDSLQLAAANYLGKTVTVVGEVYYPTGVRSGTPSGFIQDGSGRGINLFGGLVLDAVNAVGNVVAVTGLVAKTNTTVQITNYQATTLATGQPPLGPRVVPIADISKTRWLGSYIQSRSELAQAVNDVGNGVVNFVVARSDTGFAGYQIWRGQSRDPADFELLRTYSLLDSTWTFVGTERTFVDPDSIIARGTERDEDRQVPLPGPFNGFAYYYSVTWFDAYVVPNSNPPQFTIYDRQSIAEGMMDKPVYPGRVAREQTPLLADVKVVPNPYNPDAQYDRQAFPGEPRVQFIHLPRQAKVEIYTSSGDIVRSLTHEEDDDSLDWDLKNNDGKNVAPGIYIYYITAGGETNRGKFVVIR